jgi:hypothetical protein
MLRDSLPDDLKPYEDDLYRVVRDGLALFQQRFGLLRAGMRLRTERNNIHDCMVETAEKIFPGRGRWRGHLFTLALGNSRIKLKKFNKHLVTSSYPTQAVFDFLSQATHAVLTLFDRETENLQLGYVPSELSVLDYPIWIAKPMKTGSPDWEYELRPAEAVPLALPATNPNVPPKTRVTAKPIKLPKTGKNTKDE